MKLAVSAILAFALALIVGCTSVQPKNDQQAVYAASGPVGVALIAANVYQGLNSCAKPAHALPCSDDATVARVQDAKEKLVVAYKQADAVVNSPDYKAGDWQRAQVILQGALDLLIAITPVN
jgi:hypothetical protein